MKEWKAKWIWLEEAELKTNTFVHFRKKFNLDKQAKKAVVNITADSRYKLFINGTFIGRGPVPSDPRWQYYDTYEVGNLLNEGENVIAAFVLNYGEGSGRYIPGRGALLFQCNIESETGEKTVIASDSTWKAKLSDCWLRGIPRRSRWKALVEVYDAQKEISGWQNEKFDDSSWKNCFEIGVPGIEPWRELIERDIPYLYEEIVKPQRILEAGEVDTLAFNYVKGFSDMLNAENSHIRGFEKCRVIGYTDFPQNTAPIEITTADSASVKLIFDFGKTLVGHPRFKLEGVAGAIVDISYDEKLTDNIVKPNPAALNNAGRYIMKDGEQEWEAFDWEGLRYLVLTFRSCTRTVKLKEAGLRFISYPVEYRGKFSCPNPKLNEIWNMGGYTAQLCMQDTIVDCPTREQQQWCGDAVVTKLIAYDVFGDYRLARKEIIQASQSQTETGAICTAWPSYIPHTLRDHEPKSGSELPDQAMSWGASVYDYYLYSGDKTLLEKVYTNLMRVREWYISHKSANGILTVKDWKFGWIWIDHYGIDKRDEIFALNCLYSIFLDRLEKISLILNRREYAKVIKKENKRLKKILHRYFWSKEQSLYVDCVADGEKSKTFSEQANMLAILTDVAPKKLWQKIIGKIFESNEASDIKIGRPTPYFKHFIFQALAKAGRHDLTIKQIEELWYPMILKGATSWWEDWKSDAQPGSSRSHAWSGTPTYFLTTEVLGIKPIAPGFEKVLIDPHPCGLESAEGTVPTPKGNIGVRWQKQDGKIEIFAKLPDRKGEIRLTKRTVLKL